MKQIKISMEYNGSGNDDIVFNGRTYYQSGKYDTILITKREIIISAKREKNINVDNIITNTKSTLYKQLLKGIIFVYFSEGIKFNIGKIILECDSNKKEYDSIDILNPCTLDLESKFKIAHSKCELLFSDKKKINNLMIAMILYIKGYQNNDFEYLWKSFNSIYSCISPKNTEFDRLKDMRIFFDTNIVLLKRTVDLIHDDTVDEIRKLRIREFILDVYVDVSKTKGYADMVKSFEDYRLNQLFYDVMSYRIDNLKTENYYISVNNHISNCITKNCKNDLDLIRFYVLKYCYFLRNKYFHAEKSSPMFILKRNNETEEIDKINSIMKCLLADLFDCSSLYIG